MVPPTTAAIDALAGASPPMSTWALTPIVNIAVQHLQTFKEFPIRQLGMSADVGKTIEGVQSQILKLQQAN